MLTVIIPTLNAGGELGATLESLAGDGADAIDQVLVVDGGSSDETADLARAHGADILMSERGRGAQLAAGGAVANSPWLLFLHADTRLSPDWMAAVRRFAAEEANADRAGVFHFRLDDEGRAARRLERIVDWRTRRLHLPYGDQGILIGRDFYRRLGGFRPLPLMEDVDLVRRIGRKRLTVLPADAITSAARYRRHGYGPRMLRNATCLSLYFLGAPPRWIARLYG